jgi:uncharacterized metal-binding protein
MKDCCGNDAPQGAGQSCCSDGAARTVLLYACSGAANVAEVADRAARKLMSSGCGAMFCLAGLGADIADMVQIARDADLNLLIDGCSVECAKAIFDRHGLTNYRQIKVTDLGIEKAKQVPVTDAQVDAVVVKVKKVLAEE